MRDLHISRIRELSADEVAIKIKDLREELFNLSFRNSMRQLDNPLKIRGARRDLARLITVLEEHRSGLRPLGTVTGKDK
jgi:large subunit ribosomal protein L29